MRGVIEGEGGYRLGAVCKKVMYREQKTIAVNLTKGIKDIHDQSKQNTR